MTSMTSSVERTDLDFKISVALVQRLQSLVILLQKMKVWIIDTIAVPLVTHISTSPGKATLVPSSSIIVNI